MPGERKERVSESSSALSACRELFTDYQLDDKSLSNNQSLDSKCGRTSADSSRHETIHSRSLEEQLRNEKKNRADLHNDLLKLNSDIEFEKSEHAKAMLELKRLQKLLSESEGKLAAASEQLPAAERELKQLKVILNDLRSDNQKLDKLLSAERVQLSLAREELSSLQKQVSELKLRETDDEGLFDKLHKATVSLEECKRNVVRAQVELEAEVVSHSHAKQELERIRKLLSTEKVSLSATKASSLKLQQDLNNEKRAHQLTKAEVDRKETELQGEITSHNQTKINVSKLKSELATESVEHQRRLADETQIAQEHAKIQESLENVQREMEKVQLLHLETKTDLERKEEELANYRSESEKRVEALQEDLANEKATQLSESVDNEELVKKHAELEGSLKKSSELLQAEQDAHTRAKNSLARKESALHAEVRAHNETKIEAAKLRATLSDEQVKTSKDSADQNALARSKVALEAERKSHLLVKQALAQLESNLTSEKASQSLVKTTLTSVQEQLQVERSDHQQTQARLGKTEADLHTEQTNHNKTKIELVKLEAELSSEQAVRDELRRSLENVQSACNEQEEEVKVLRAGQAKDCEHISLMKTQRNQEREQLEGLKASHSQVTIFIIQTQNRLFLVLTESCLTCFSNYVFLSSIPILHEFILSDLFHYHNPNVCLLTGGLRKPLHKNTVYLYICSSKILACYF